MITSEIIEIKGSKPGPNVAIFAGVHGNETVGILALQELLPDFKLTKGKLFIAFANPPAIEANVRMVDKNLNRCFIEGNSGSSYEDTRARELMEILDKCEALLDIHMFYDNSGLPFVICEDSSLDLARKLDVGLVSTNWTAVEPGGTDGYMFLKDKIGICFECGPISRAVEYKALAVKTIRQFLKYFDMTDDQVHFSNRHQRLIRAQYAVIKNSPDFRLLHGFSNFDRLKAGQTIATSKNKLYRANPGECIIFPHYKARLHEEAYIIGREIELTKTKFG